MIKLYVNSKTNSDVHPKPGVKRLFEGKKIHSSMSIVTLKKFKFVKTGRLERERERDSLEVSEFAAVLRRQGPCSTAVANECRGWREESGRDPTFLALGPRLSGSGGFGSGFSFFFFNILFKFRFS